MRQGDEWVFCVLLGALNLGSLALAQTTPSKVSARTVSPIVESPLASVIVTGRRFAKSCGEKDRACVLAVTKEVWKHYPNQIQTYCQTARTQQQFQRTLVEQLGLSSAYDSRSATEVDDTLPPALAQVCNYKAERSHQIASNWVPWSAVPSSTDLTAAFPRSAKTDNGDARINCKVEDNGHLEDCHLSDEEPEHEGFGKAAMSLAGKFRVNLGVARAMQANPLWVDVDVQFAHTVDTSRSIAEPDWTILPDPDTTAGLFPTAATKAGVVSGVGKVDCRIAEDGTLNGCILVSEEPANLGFGAAALAVTPQMHVNLWTRDGQRAAGAHVVAPLRFDAPDAEAPKPSAGE